MVETRDIKEHDIKAGGREDVSLHNRITYLGTPQELHDAQGKVVWAAEYSAYGQVRRHMVHAIVNPIRFAGQYFDDETGLHYNRFRYYDPQAGRYVNQDPIGLEGGWNQYAYVENNPIIGTDLLGLARWIDCGKGCYIRIDKNHAGNGRHLPWKCKGRGEGTMGEFGKDSHGEDYSSAPNSVKECARKNGFEPCPSSNAAAMQAPAPVPAPAPTTDDSSSSSSFSIPSAPSWWPAFVGTLFIFLLPVGA